MSVACEKLPQFTIRKEIRELWLHVSFHCNLTCRHCLFSCSPNYQGDNPDLTLNQAQKYVSSALVMGIKALYITGGEPLLWKPLKDFLNWYYEFEKVVPLVILTNGTLITQNWAKLFAKYKDKKLELRVSMECYSEGNHEEYRGKGSYRRVIVGIGNLNQFQVYPWIAFVNKSGGMSSPKQVNQLEQDFNKYLHENHNIKIAGLKVIGAYNKGNFTGKIKNERKLCNVRSKLSQLQCAYGVAISGLGLVSCPILTDVPEAVLDSSLEELTGQPVAINFEYCNSCFRTGSTCGQ